MADVFVNWTHLSFITRSAVILPISIFEYFTFLASSFISAAILAGITSRVPESAATSVLSAMIISSNSSSSIEVMSFPAKSSAENVCPAEYAASNWFRSRLSDFTSTSRVRNPLLSMTPLSPFSAPVADMCDRPLFTVRFSRFI